MYTCCPDCRTWFRVTEAQLAVARGWVRCGQCRGSFDAAARLWSEPDEGSRPVSRETERDLADVIGVGEVTGVGDVPDAPGVPDIAPEAVPEPSGETIRERAPDRLSEPPPESPVEDDGPLAAAYMEGVDLEAGLESEPPGPTVGDVRRVTAEGPEVRPGPDRIHEGRVAARRRRSREQAILNRIEGLDIRRGRRWSSNSSIALIVLLALQYVWFMAGDLSATFPFLSPALDEFCAVTRCETQRRPADHGIRVVSRTVRPHAEYTSALSVRATLENRSSENRPYPVVVLVLYGRDGRAVASRAFEPAEYLDGGAVPAAGLESGHRVDIAFDLVTPSEVAVSFDLRLI